MKNLLKIIVDFFTPNSTTNLDRNISYFKQVLIENHSFNSEMISLEKSIDKASSEKLKHTLKIQFRDKLKKVYDDLEYEAMKETIDRAW